MLTRSGWKTHPGDLIVPEALLFDPCEFFVANGYKIPVIVLSDGPSGNMRMIWKANAGGIFNMERHRFPHFLRFLRGRGTFRHGAEFVSYPVPHASVMVEAAVPHHLAQIIEDTIVLQINPIT
jgi:hypothetical protein